MKNQIINQRGFAPIVIIGIQDVSGKRPEFPLTSLTGLTQKDSQIVIENKSEKARYESLQFDSFAAEEKSSKV